MHRFNSLLRYVCLVGVFLGSGLAQEFYYAGELGDDLGIQMQLRLNGKQLEGSYYYNSVGNPLTLTGSLEGQSVRLEEYVDAQLSAVFSGEFSDAVNDFASSLTGDWVHAYGNQLEFSLTKVAEFVELDMQQARISAESYYPFFLAPNWQAANALFHSQLLDKQNRFFLEAQEAVVQGELYNGWTLEHDLSIAYYSTDLISVFEFIYVYSGGAHPNAGFKSYTLFQDGDMHLLSLNDLFPDTEFMSVLAPIVFEDLLNQDAYYLADGSITTLNKSNLSTFTLNPKGVTFHFEPYAVGPYAQGSFEVLIPFEELDNLITEQSPLARFIKSR